MAKFKFHVSTNKVGSETEEVVEIPDEELEGMDDKEKEDMLEEVFEEWVWENIDTTRYKI
jgi:hypothetical protein